MARPYQCIAGFRLGMLWALADLEKAGLIRGNPNLLSIEEWTRRFKEVVN